MKKGAPIATYDNFRKRIWIIVGLVFLSCAVLVVETTRIQILQHDELKQKGINLHLKSVENTGKRGNIVDRHGVPLAFSSQVASVWANPREFNNVETMRNTAQQVAAILNMDKNDVYARLIEDRAFIYIKRHVDAETAKKISEAKIPGIFTMKEGGRVYPKKVASNIIGFVNIDNEGLEGIELRYNKQLQGRTEKTTVRRDGAGRLLRDKQNGEDKSLDGDTIKLTIDVNIQSAAEFALQRAVNSYDALGGNMVVMNVKNGEILAMASYPTYDSNEGKASKPEERKNKAIVDVFEPGSVFKTFVAAAYIENKPNFDPDAVFIKNYPQPIRVNNFSIKEAHPHLNMTATDVLAYSSNVGAATMALEIGRDKYYQQLVKFGFGQKTGIELAGEMGGILHKPEKWKDVNLANIAFGQGVAVTTLQLAAAYAAIANDGIYNPPKIIVGTEAKESHRAISASTAKKLQKMLSAVVEKGTGRGHATMREYTCGGKTGTAQKIASDGHGYSQELFHAVFAGFAPLEDPQVVVVVDIDEPHGPEHQGGPVAGPVFAEVAQASLKAMLVRSAHPGKTNRSLIAKIKKISEEVERDAPVELETVIAKKELKEGKLPSLQEQPVGLALRTLGAMVDPETVINVQGSGLVIKQEPAAGTALNEVRKVTLYCAPRSDGKIFEEDDNG